jgi:hypothetical protein
MTSVIQKFARVVIVGILAAVVLFAGCAGGNGEPSSSGGNGGGIEKAKGPAIGVSPSVTNVSVGEEFDINIVVKLPNPVMAIGCQLKWTSSDSAGTGKIECTGEIDDGTFMTQNLVTVEGQGDFKPISDSKDKPLRMGGKYDASSGTTEPIALTVIGEKKGVQGDGDVFTFHFKAIEAGEVTLEVYDVQIVDLQYGGVEVATYNGKVVIE